MAGRFSIEAVFKAVDRVTAPVTRMQNRVSKFTRGLTRGLRNASRAADKMGSALWAGLRRGGLAIAGAAAVAGVALTSFASDADTLAKQARRLDFDIGALQEWRFVAEQSGLSAEEFSKSLEALNKRVGEARSGQGSLYSYLKRTDRALLRQLQATENAGDAFELLVGAMERAPTPMQRAALAAAAFSRQGLKTADIATQGAEAVRKLRLEQRENGNITMRQAEAAEKYNDAMNSARRSLTGMRNHALAPLLPIFTELAERARAWAVVNRELVTERTKQGLAWLVDNFEQIVTWAKRIGAAIAVFYALAAALKSFVLIMAVVNAVMAANPVGLIVLGIYALILAIGAAVIWWDELKAGLLSAWDAFAGLPVVVKGVGIAILTLMGPVGWLAAAALLIADNWGRLVGVFESIKETILGFDLKGMLWDKIEGLTDVMPDWVKRRLGIEVGGREYDEDAPGPAPGPAPQVISPQERVARQIDEQRTTSSAEVTIRDETGRAELRERGRAPGVSLELQRSGAF